MIWHIQYGILIDTQSVIRKQIDMPSAMMAFEILQHQVDILGCVVISGYDRQSGYNVASFGKILEILQYLFV